MRNFLRTLFIGSALLSMSSASALSLLGGNIDIDVASGWRQDHLQWQDSTDVGTTERDFKNIRSWMTYGEIEYEWCRIVLRGYGNYGKIYGGHSTITAEATDGTVIDFRDAESDRGEVFDYGVALGYRFEYCCMNQGVVFTPFLGWSQHEQHLRQFMGQDATGFVEMHNNYQTRWYGPWLGYDFRVNLGCSNWSIWQNFQYHWTKFRARGHDNEGEAPLLVIDEYSQKDNGHGYVIGGGVDYQINRCWSIGFMGSYTNLHTHNGSETIDATSPLVVTSTPDLDFVKWHSWNVLAKIDYNF